MSAVDVDFYGRSLYLERKMPRIFLSYARDDVDPNFATVVKDLRREIAQAAPMSQLEVFFKDKESIDLGQDWSAELAGGVGDCELFLAVYSPLYFTRPYCGKEWTAFSSRIDKARDKAQATRCLMPLWWRPVESSLVSLPRAAARLQDDHETLPADYRAAGLRALLMTRDSREYNLALQAFVALVIKALSKARAAGLGALSETNIDALDDAFAQKPAPVPVQPTIGKARSVRFAVAAGTPAEMRAHRRHVDTYDDEAIAWQPYVAGEPIFKALVEAALQEGLAPVLEAMEPDFEDQLARNKRHPLIVVADPWSVMLERFRTLAEALDSKFQANLGAVVPAADDNESAELCQTRDNLLWATLPQRLAGVDRDSFFHPVKDPNELVPALRKLITELRQRIVKTLPTPPGGNFPSRPKLHGPGAS